MACVFEARKSRTFERSLIDSRGEGNLKKYYTSGLRPKVHPFTPSYIACTIKTEGIPIVCLLMIQFSHTYVRTLNSKAFLST